MIRVHRGRDGWANDFGALTRTAGMALVVVALALGGCSSKKKNAAAGANGAGGSQLGENGMGAGGGSSLTQAQNGTLGNGAQGPLGDIHFDYNDATIRNQDGAILKSNAQWLESHPSQRVQIEGHCDDRGSEEYNIALGARRAQAAKDYLSTLGIAGDRMSTISYGKELPICTEETDDCWAQNRRDHFAVSQ